MGIGSISFKQEPVNTADKVPVITNWTPLIGYMVHQDDISGLFYFKLILEIRLDDASGTLLGKVKQRRNGYSVDVAANEARAFFDLRDIVNSQLIDTVFDQNDTGVPFRTIHKVGANTTAKPFSVNGDNTTDKTQIQTIYVKAYQQYSSTASAVPTEYTSPTVNDTLIYLQASLPLMTPRSAAGYIQGTDFNVFNGSGSSDRFLSDLETSSGDYNLSGYINYVQWNDATDVGDYHTVAFLNDTANFDSETNYVEIVYYNSSGAVIGNKQYILNDSSNGGWEPDNSEATTPSDPMENKYQLLYFGAGPGNLEESIVESWNGTSEVFGGAQPSNFTNWAYYTVRMCSNKSPATISYKTAPYYFIKQDGSCKGFKVRRLAWRNSVGGYDYFNFKKKSTQTVGIQRNNYNSLIGTYNKSQWRYNNTQSGKQTRQVTATLKETLNTDWISEQDGNLLEKLIMSTAVYIVENADTTYTQAVMITDSSHVRKTIANDRKIQYTINIEYANPLNTNS
mgnify:CR=1 FL=1